MIHTIGETAKILNIAPSTLRYYDKEGLLPFVERSKSGIRMFQDKDFSWLFIIECLKKSGLSIKEIKNYIDMSLQGDETISDRLQLFIARREKVKEQMRELQETLDILDYKCWYYETAQKKGSVDDVRNMNQKDIPVHLQKAKTILDNIHNA